MRPRRSYFILPVVIVPLLFLLQRLPVQEQIHQATAGMLKPVLSAGHQAVRAVTTVRDQAVYFWKTFRNQKEDQARIAALESQLVRYEEVMKENARLRSLLDFKNTLEGKKIAARVIGWDPSPWRKTLLIDKGREHGIRKDMAVLVHEGLVGRITEAGETTSRVLLMTDPDARVSAVATDSRAQGVVAGTGKPVLEMKYLLLDSGVRVEETILTSGIGTVFPKGIRVGRIKELHKDVDGMHLAAVVEPFVDFSKLEEVLCLESSLQG